MTETKCTILQMTDLDDGSPSGIEGSPTVACQTSAGWLAVRFDSDEQIYVASLSEAQVKELGLPLDLCDTTHCCLTVNRIFYTGWTFLRPHGWGDDSKHEAHHSSYRLCYRDKPGWLDRELRDHWTRANSFNDGPTESARMKLRALVETVVAELVASRPALVDFGQAADLRRQMETLEGDIFELKEKAEQKVCELRDLRARLEDMSR